MTWFMLSVVIKLRGLHDLNKDGFADFYENFNNEIMASTNFHAFTLNLETDSQGNFYFATSTPWPPYGKGEGPSKDEEITPITEYFINYRQTVRNLK
jgi:hypothetical protein